MSDLITIQNFCDRNDSEPMICSFETETISAPTSPILHSMARMWLINEGEGTVLINNKEYCLKKGCCVGVLPWQITEVIEVKKPITFYLVVYYYDNVNEIVKTFYNPGSIKMSIWRRITERPLVELHDRSYQEMQRLFMQLEDEVHEIYKADAAEESEEDRALRNLFITNKLVEIMLVLMRYKKEPEKKEASIDASEIFLYLYSHLNERVTLEELSHKFYMSESVIGAYIKRTTGLSFFDLMNEMRIGRTMNYLLYTDLTLEELSEILGFVDSAHISKVFKARTGMKASDYRKTYQKIGDRCQIRDRKVYYEIVAYIYRHYTEDLKVSDLSRKFCVTVKNLNRILLYQVEMTFHGYLNYIRVNKASEMLLTTDKTILDIAMEVGYNTEKTLSRNFIMIRHITPGKFRATMRFQGIKNT